MEVDPGNVTSWVSWAIRWATSFSIFGGSIFSIIVALLMYNQEKLIFHPDVPTRKPQLNDHPFNTPLNWSIPFESVNVTTSDHHTLHMWLLKHPRPSPTLIYFQGNAGNMGHRLSFFKIVFELVGFNVLAVSYRGYGNSTGAATERGLMTDAQAALAFLIRRSRDNSSNNNDNTQNPIDASKLFLFGRSLGGAVAIETAANPLTSPVVAGMIVENTFTSIGDMATSVFPFLKVLQPIMKMMIRVPMNSIGHVNNVKCPVLFVSGQEDELVPPQQMETLASCATSAPFKQIYRVAHGTHNETWRTAGRDYVSVLTSFYQKATASNAQKNINTVDEDARTVFDKFLIDVGDHTGIFSFVDYEHQQPSSASYNMENDSLNASSSSASCASDSNFNLNNNSESSLFSRANLKSRTAGL